MGPISEVDAAFREKGRQRDGGEVFRRVISRSNAAIYDPLTCEYDRKVLYYPREDAVSRGPRGG
jgi:hypothetical protein